MKLISRAILILLVVATADAAEAVQLTSGTITRTWFASGHAFGPDLEVFFGTDATLGTHMLTCPCAPGTTFTPLIDVFLEDGGTIIYQGQTWVAWDGPISSAGLAHISWDAGAAEVLLPPVGDPFAVTEPFNVSLQMSLAPAGCIGVTACSQTVGLGASGTGFVTISFQPDAIFPQWWDASAVYTIVDPAAVAEPSAGLLLALGAIGLLCMWRNHGRAARARA